METIEEITEEVIAENKDEIKKIIKESVKKGIADALGSEYSSVVVQEINKMLKESIKETVTQEDIDDIINEAAPRWKNDIRNAMAAIGLKLSSILFAVMTDKLKGDWDRQKLFDKLFNEA